MNIPDLLIASIIGTITMTAFSYAVSLLFKAFFTEPLLLEYVAVSNKANGKRFIGWCLHFLIGIAFSLIFYILWKLNIISFDYYSWIILAVGSGIAGIAGWMGLFAISARETSINKKAFYLQLFFAHVIFTFTVYGMLIWLK